MSICRKLSVDFIKFIFPRRHYWNNASEKKGNAYWKNSAWGSSSRSGRYASSCTSSDSSSANRSNSSSSYNSNNQLATSSDNLPDHVIFARSKAQETQGQWTSRGAWDSRLLTSRDLHFLTGWTFREVPPTTVSTSRQVWFRIRRTSRGEGSLTEETFREAWPPTEGTSREVWSPTEATFREVWLPTESISREGWISNAAWV